MEMDGESEEMLAYVTFFPGKDFGCVCRCDFECMNDFECTWYANVYCSE